MCLMVLRLVKLNILEPLRKFSRRTVLLRQKYLFLNTCKHRNCVALFIFSRFVFMPQIWSIYVALYDLLLIFIFIFIINIYIITLKQTIVYFLEYVLYYFGMIRWMKKTDSI